MSTFEQKIANLNNWTIELTHKIIFEYERFLTIKASNQDLIPPDKIEKLWIFHILLTENYYNYCNHKFNKIIHYDHTLIHTSEEKLNKILTTIKIYKNVFGTITNPEVWSLSCEFNFNDLEKIVSPITQPISNQPISNQPISNQPISNQPISNQPISNLPISNQPMFNLPSFNLPISNQPMFNLPSFNLPISNQPSFNQPLLNQPILNQPSFNQPSFNQPILNQPSFNQNINLEQIPDYKTNRPRLEHLKLFIKYQNINKPGPFNLQLIDYKYSPNDCYQNIKEIISNNTLYPVKNIKIIPHPEIYNKNFLNISGGELHLKLNVNKTINSCDFIIVEIYEVEI
jgi:hypothetical protein